MRLLKYLNEKWVDSFKDSLAGGVAEIFVNPSKSEYRDALNASKGSMLHAASARAVYDYERDKLYVWRGDVLHQRVIGRVSGIPRKSLRITIEPDMKIIHVYDAYQSEERELEITKNAVKRIYKFAPETKSYKVAKASGRMRDMLK